MMAKTHILIGVSYGLPLLPAIEANRLTPEQFIGVMVGLVIGSLLPDLDHPHSLASQLIPFVGVISKLTRHRGFLHSILGLLMVFMGLSIFNGIMGLRFTEVFAGLLIGYVLHITADSFTLRGVRLLYPFKWNIGIKVIRTGGLFEFAMRWCLILFCGYQILDSII